MYKKELQEKVLATSIMNNKNTKDLIATLQKQPWIFENKIIFDMINNVFSKVNHCTEDLLLSESIKTNCMETYNQVIVKNIGKLFSHDYKKYKADLLEVTTKEKIVSILTKVLKENKSMSSEQLIAKLDLKEFRNKLETEVADVDINSTIFEVMEDLDKNDNNGILTGLNGIDKRMGCIQDGELVVLTAQPSAGKSTLGLQMLLHNSMERNKNGIFFSLEMSKKIAIKRMMSTVGMIDHGLFKTKPSESDYKRMLDVQSVIYHHTPKMKLVAGLESCTSTDIYTMSQSIKRANKWKKIDYILIDYLQYMTGEKSEKEHSILSENIKRLKELTVELNCVIIVISSLGQNDQLYGSSFIKYAADMIISLHKGETFHDDGQVLLKVEKNRNGECFNQEIKLNGKYMKFEEIDMFH